LLDSLGADHWLFFTHDHSAAAARVGLDPETKKYAARDVMAAFQRESFA
jgi:hypothetical protein